jgi:HK97 family phage prohead protease
MSKLEIRSFQIRADGGQSSDPQYLLRGRAATYGSMSADLGGFRERIQRGAFANHLRGNPDVVCNFNHGTKSDVILGRTSSGTLKLIDGDEGLDFRCQLDKDNSQHRDIYSSIRRMDIRDCSFAFNVDGDDGDEFDNASDERGQRYARRTVKRAKIYDVSVVVNPAYQNGATNVSARFSEDQPRDADGKFGSGGGGGMSEKEMKSLKEGDVVSYDDGRKGHQGAEATVLENGEHFVVVQFKDRAHADTIKHSDTEWTKYLSKRFSVFGPDGKIHLSLEERILAQAYVIRKDREQFEADQQERWKNDASYQAWLASAEPVRLRSR